MCTYSLFATKSNAETWGYLVVAGGEKIPITHWENVIGKNKSADIRIDNETISKDHALLTRKGLNKWLIKDLHSLNGINVNGKSVKSAIITRDDSVAIGDTFISVEDIIPPSQHAEKNISLFPVAIAITIFQGLTAIQLLISTGSKAFFPIINSSHL